MKPSTALFIALLCWGPATAGYADEAREPQQPGGEAAEQAQPADAALTAELERNNRELQSQNAALRQQLDERTAELALLRESRDNAMFRNGALAVLGGVLIALVIPRLLPKKKSEWA